MYIVQTNRSTTYTKTVEEAISQSTAHSYQIKVEGGALSVVEKQVINLRPTATSTSTPLPTTTSSPIPTPTQTPTPSPPRPTIDYQLVGAVVALIVVVGAIYAVRRRAKVQPTKPAAVQRELLPPPAPIAPARPSVRPEAAPKLPAAPARFCSNCGAKMVSEEVFCSNCGQHVKEGVGGS